MKKLRTAIIGTGFMGKVHAENVRRLGNVEIAAVADYAEEPARKFGQAIGVEHTTGDYQTLLKDPDDRRRPCFDSQRAALSDVQSGSQRR